MFPMRILTPFLFRPGNLISAQKKCKMPNARMATGYSHGESIANSDEWVNKLQERLDMMKKQSSGNGMSDFIFRLPKVRSYDEQYYVPRLVSIGPYHFGKPELANMEKEKDEAMLRMERRIQKSLPEQSMKSIIESDIVPIEKTIKDFYADEIPYTPTVLAWMVTRDACFIFELLLNIPRRAEGLEHSQEEKRVSVKHSNIFDGRFLNPTIQNLLVDCFLFENQIPGFVLELLISKMMGSPDAAREKLNHMMNEITLRFPTPPTPPFTWRVSNDYVSPSHLLEALYVQLVGGSEGLGFLQSSKGEEMKLSTATILSAVQLDKAGVRFHVVHRTDKHDEGEMSIKFDPQTSTLYLPKLIISHYGDYILRNLIALEASSDKYGQPMTMFARFMDELIDSEADAALLCERGVIDNVLGTNKQVANLFNSIAKECKYATGFKPIDDAKIGLLNYQRRNYKILWSQFVKAYFSKPWLVAGSIGAVLIIFGTSVQVFCLFYTCNKFG